MLNFLYLQISFSNNSFIFGVFALVLFLLLSVLLYSRTFLFILVTIEILLVSSILILLLTCAQTNSIAFLFYLLLFGAGETTILLSCIIKNSEAYRFLSQSNGSTFFT